MDVSIIIPVHNLEAFIIRTLDSLFTNSKITFEIIIVNDGSTDNSEQLILDYQSNSTKNINYIFQKNSGVSTARNTGILNAKGDYIIFLDGDDFVEPEYIDKLYYTAHFNDCDVVTCLYNHVFPSGKKYSRNYDRYTLLPDLFTPIEFLHHFLLNTTILNTGSLIFKAELIKNYNIFFDSKMTHSEDHKFFVTAFLHSKKIFLLKDILYNYYQRTESLTHKCNPITIRARLLLFTYLLKIFRQQPHKFKDLSYIVQFYNIPESINGILELYAHNNYDHHFKRLIQRKIIKRYIFFGIICKFTPLKRRFKYLLLLTNPPLFKFYCRHIESRR